MSPQAYIALPTSPDSSLSFDDTAQSCPCQAKAQNDSHILSWACIATICSSVLSIALFVFGAFPHAASNFSNHQAQTSTLRRASTYMNLEKVQRNNTDRFPPITGFSDILLQINPGDPLRTLREDDRGYYSQEGGIYPDDRHFSVSSVSSTVVQFRNLDFGMEKCVLHVIAPPKTMKHNPETRIDPSSRLDVWLLDSTTEISVYLPGSWDHAPARRTKLATFSFSEGAKLSSGEFRCVSGQFSTFEFSCSKETTNCFVDFWQVKGAPLNGVYMRQYDSLVI